MSDKILKDFKKISNVNDELINNEAVEKYGHLEYDECFGYVPLLALGGKESVDNLKKVKIHEHIVLITEIAGKI